MRAMTSEGNAERTCFRDVIVINVQRGDRFNLRSAHPPRTPSHKAFCSNRLIRYHRVSVSEL